MLLEVAGWVVVGLEGDVWVVVVPMVGLEMVVLGVLVVGVDWVVPRAGLETAGVGLSAGVGSLEVGLVVVVAQHLGLLSKFCNASVIGKNDK